LSISPTTITSGGSAMLTITLSAAPTEVAAVTLTSSNNTVLPVLSPYGITPGQASASFTIQAGAVTSPTSVTVTASYDGSSQHATVTINPANAAPGFTLSASPATLSITQGGRGTSTITLTDLGGFSGNASLSMSGLPSGVTGSFANGSAAGTQVLTLTASTSAAVTSTPVTITITGTSGTLNASTTIALTINAEPSFTSGNGGTSSITIGPGATTGNTGTISVVGTNGFAGTVNLSCAITTSLTNVNDVPTCGLNPNSVAISGTAAQASVLTVTTTAASSAENQMKKLFGPLTGGMTLAWVVIFAVPRRQRHRLTMWALLLLSVFVGTIGCAGGSGGGGGRVGGGGGEGGGNSGTTAGTYTITVTGTSGTTSATVGTITLAVQ
jgi:trimeric autotransporter adhesin